jgi:hypothetical protein
MNRFCCTAAREPLTPGVDRQIPSLPLRILFPSPAVSSLQVPPTHTEPFFRLHFDHPSQEALAVWGNEVGHMEDTPFHLLQQLAEVVIIKWQSPLREK